MINTALTTTSPCTGCDRSVASPAWAMEDKTVWVFREAEHPGCGGRYTRLVPLLTVYSAPPEKKRWWRR